MSANLAILLDPFACVAFGRSATDGPSKQAVIVPTAVRSRSDWQFCSAARWPAERRKVCNHVAGSERLGDFVDLEAVLRGSAKQQRIAYLSALLRHAKASCAIEGVEWKGLHVLVPSYVMALLSPNFVVGNDGRTLPEVFEIKLESAGLTRDLRLAAAHAGFERTAVSPSYFHAARTACRDLELEPAQGQLGCVVELGLGGIGVVPFSLEKGNPVQDNSLRPYFIAWDVKSFLLERLRAAANKTPQLVGEAQIAEELLANLPARLIGDGHRSEIEITLRGEPVVLSSLDHVFGADWTLLKADIRRLLAERPVPLIPNEFVEQVSAAEDGRRYFARYTLTGSLAHLPRMDVVLDELVCADPSKVQRFEAFDKLMKAGDNEEIEKLGILDHSKAGPDLRRLLPAGMQLADSISQTLSDVNFDAKAIKQGVYSAVKVGPDSAGNEENAVRDDMTQPQVVLFDSVATAPASWDSLRSWHVEIPVMLRSGIDDGVSREFRVVFHLMPWNLGQRLEIELRVLPSHRVLLTASIAGVVAAVDVVPEKIDRLEQYPDTVRDDLASHDASSLVRCIDLGRFELTASPLHQRLTDALDAGEISHSFATTATE